jgi:Flp pilus assembly pilin Flp
MNIWGKLVSGGLKNQRGVAMAEYAIVFSAITLVFALILSNMFEQVVVNGVSSYSIRPTIPALNDMTNPLYGFKAYFARITDFLALPIP